MIVTFLPSQTIPHKEKLEKGKYINPNESASDNNVQEKSWGELCVDFHVGLAITQETKRNELYTLYRVKEGKLNNSDYSHILNPLNTENPDFKRFPANLRSYNIIKPIINELLGERTEKPLIPMCIIGNKEANNIFKDKLTKAANSVLQQQFINYLNELGIDTNVPSQEVPNIEDFVKQFSESYDEEKANDAQNIVEYLTYDLELDEKYQVAYEHWLTCGKVISYINVLDNDIEHEIVHPIDYFHPINGLSGTGKIEDDTWGVRRFRFISKSEILDRLRIHLDKEDLDYVEEQYRLSGKPYTSTVVLSAANGYVQDVTQKDNIPYEMSGHSDDNLLLWHVNWKSFRKIGILTTTNEIGEPYEIEVDETYKLDTLKGDIDIEWKYITEVWEGYRLDGLNNNTYRYFGIQPLPIQRTELNSKQKAKLQYHGRYDIDIDGNLISVVKTSYPYQVLFNAFHFQFEKIINKNKDKILMMPMGLFPKKEGWSEDKFFYFMEAMNIAVFDETKPNAIAALQGLKSIDMSLSQYATKMVEFLQSIRQELWDAVGMNRQRFGQTNSSDGKAVNEQAVFHSALITAELVRKFDKFVERDYQAMIDWSKIAWIDGKKVNFVRSDGSKVLLQINPEDHIGTDYNMFVKNSNEEYKKLQIMQNIALTLAQNKTRGSVIADMLDSNNIKKLSKILKEGERIEDEYNKQLQESQNNAMLQAKQMEVEAENTKQETEMYKSDKQYDAVIEKELLITERELALAETNGEGEGSENGISPMDMLKHNHEIRKQTFVERKHKDELERKDRKLDIDEYKAKHPPKTKK